MNHILNHVKLKLDRRQNQISASGQWQLAQQLMASGMISQGQAHSLIAAGFTPQLKFLSGRWNTASGNTQQPILNTQNSQHYQGSQQQLTSTHYSAIQQQMQASQQGILGQQQTLFGAQYNLFTKALWELSFDGSMSIWTARLIDA